MSAAHNANPATTTAVAPRWLDDDERRTWIAWILSTRLLWDELERDLQRDAGIAFSYYEVLVMLSESPDRSRRMSDLADATQSSRSRLSHAVTRLEGLGWVRRESCPSDRRGSLAVLTDAGFAALEAAAPDHVKSVRAHIFDQLSPAQLAQLREISDVLLDHLLPIVSSRDESNAGRIEMARARLGQATEGRVRKEGEASE
jgi:DNA-binding MarR family transcriptional regulator